MNTPTDIDEALERAYNVRALRPDFVDVVNDWAERSDAYRAAGGGILDLHYGPAERQRLDIFPARGTGPTLIYLHGGYWQSGDKSLYSFLARSFVRRGVNLVTMGYSLCPTVTVPEIVEEIRTGLTRLYRHGSHYDLDPSRLNVAGHSAGGHLTAMTIATDWTARGADLPATLVKSGIPISGLYNLAPLRRTTINQAARIGEDAVHGSSPLLLAPRSGTRVLAVVGGAETPAFHAQADDLQARWNATDAKVERYTEPDADHFDVVNRLADPDSKLFAKALETLVY